VPPISDLINGDNPLGIVTGNSVKTRLAELQADLEKAEADLVAQAEVRSAWPQLDEMEEHISATSAASAKA
jgi:hypothetical protein